ncbi:MAG: class I SAM-dependent methyltransferase [Nakamurella multipartita]
MNAANPDRPAGLPLTDLEIVDRLGEDLRTGGFDATGVPELLGAAAHRALGRGEPAAALRATRDGSTRSTLVRLFLLGANAAERDVARALPATGVAAALAQGVLERDGDELRAALDIRPHAADDEEFLLVSDLDSDVRPGPVRPDHVLGLGSASITLARAIVRDPVTTALDLGTGCGIQALHLAGHAGSIVATDISPRALALAGATARLNQQHWDLRAGSLFDPVAGEQFDLIVSNPPFVVGDGTTRFTYRDSGLPGDGVGRAIVEGARTHLRPGGTAQLLANWLVVDDGDWRDRVGGWVAASGCDAWVVQREIADPVEYVGLWLADAGEDAKSGGDRARAHRLAQDWLDYFAAQRITGIGMGMITLRRTDADDPSITLDEIADDPVTGTEVGAFLTNRAWVESRTDAELLGQRFRLADQVLLEQSALPGPEGWDVMLRLVRRLGGAGATLQVDEWGQSLLAGCTGALPLAVLIELLAGAHVVPAGALAEAIVPAVRVAVTRGLLVPIGD